ncbi:MAG: hypothetical protein WCK02_11350 [Bacteroidota bacterium]
MNFYKFILYLEIIIVMFRCLDVKGNIHPIKNIIDNEISTYFICFMLFYSDFGVWTKGGFIGKG